MASAALTDMAVAFPGQKMGQGGAIFGALVKILHKPEPDFDPDRLSVLHTRSAEEWDTERERIEWRRYSINRTSEG